MDGGTRPARHVSQGGCRELVPTVPLPFFGSPLASACHGSPASRFAVNFQIPASAVTIEYTCWKIVF
jgi:hypothetical protein